ncbi:MULTISPECIES: hypothetical protein [Pedobacter]|uniref:hypothetical protein n=1 Tax=Pedobacter TaxID=84567 RepID=UPI00292FDF50|nr:MULTISPECIES: hypothetical protein [Pedobacter]
MKLRFIILVSFFCLVMSCKEKKQNKNNEAKIKRYATKKTEKKSYKNNEYLVALLDELEKPNKEVKYNQKDYKKIGIKVKYPLLNNPKFNSIIFSDIERSLRINYCGKKQNVQIDYELSFLTDKMVSILKRVSVLQCSPSDFLYLGKFNVIEINRRMYVVDLSESYYNYLNKNKWKIFNYNEYKDYISQDVSLGKIIIFKNKNALIRNVFHSKIYIDDEYKIPLIDSCFSFKKPNNQNIRFTNE